LLLNISHVSTFTSKILRGFAQAQLNELKDLAALPVAAASKTMPILELNPYSL
jgi:hypothetical protein